MISQRIGLCLVFCDQQLDEACLDSEIDYMVDFAIRIRIIHSLSNFRKDCPVVNTYESETTSTQTYY